MRRQLLDLIVCPVCRGSFGLEVFSRATTQTRTLEGEIVDGALWCTDCDGAYPVIGGVPRLLRVPLLARMRARYPAFFTAHPEFLSDADPETHELADTLDSFTRQRLDFAPPDLTLAAQWRANLARNLGATLGGASLRGKLILDVGCGFGRHMYVAAEQGAEVVGIDLSGGVDRAYATTRTQPNCHVVQGNIFDRPLRDGSFDIVWSFGVLHHLPEPRAGFHAIVPFARPDGGTIIIWVYGYSGMALSYRLSHMRALHRHTRLLSGTARARASRLVAGLLSLLYWEPLRLARGMGLGPIVQRLPLTDYLDHTWSTRIAGVHDRLSTPITHFHDSLELSEWCRSTELQSVRIEDTDRRGWRASGKRLPKQSEEGAHASPRRPRAANGDRHW